MRQFPRLALLALICLALLATVPAIRRSYAAACPSGSFCAAFPAFWSTFTYVISGGTTARSDLARWGDNWIEAPEIGVDCTGSTDSTSALQAAVTANASLHVEFPIGCRVNISSTITRASGIGISFRGANFVGNGSIGTPPTLTWTGGNGSSGCGATFADCIYMFDIEASDHPMFENLSFAASRENCLDGFIKFDGNPTGGTIGTNGLVTGNSFNNGSCANANFVGINVGPTAWGNQENYRIEQNQVYCSNSVAILRSMAASVTGTALTEATGANFTSADVGKKIVVSYASGALVTTIAAVISTTAVTLTDGDARPLTNATVHVGQSYGIAVNIGTVGNELQEVVSQLQYLNCAIGVNQLSGTDIARSISGGYSDIGIYATGGWIDSYAAENDVQGIVVRQSTPEVYITNARVSNGNQRADGFFNFGAGGAGTSVYIANSAPPGTALWTNSILIGLGPSTLLTSIENNFGALTWSQTGYSVNDTSPNLPVTSIGDKFANGTHGAQIGCYGAAGPACVTLSKSFGSNIVTPSDTAPGATGMKIETVCGTNSGTAKIIVYAGTSNTPTTLLDNIGSGVRGC
jgi:hypothetical protein